MKPCKYLTHQISLAQRPRRAQVFPFNLDSQFFASCFILNSAHPSVKRRPFLPPLSTRFLYLQSGSLRKYNRSTKPNWLRMYLSLCDFICGGILLR
ncbi:hypothetical protein TRFO_24930 [Tritrichomonas foetus]|uniref:Uncharacterized protein n=1 Tax=Tritrichomonas foetus TaxID=1144522 RepID=A0A1J4K6B7_9EUKA|nr:hypothetical protein TRFO_24930 [Tritrichomonas foetus]|eukprot:OHT06959.1 hypothetical protein TRFO_24930 [Tritrichomonas foetus]